MHRKLQSQDQSQFMLPEGSRFSKRQSVNQPVPNPSLHRVGSLDSHNDVMIQSMPEKGDGSYFLSGWNDNIQSQEEVLKPRLRTHDEEEDVLLRDFSRHQLIVNTIYESARSTKQFVNFGKLKRFHLETGCLQKPQGPQNDKYASLSFTRQNSYRRVPLTIDRSFNK